MTTVHMKRIRIGVLGCANIAHRSMIPAILNLPELFKLIAIASRTAKKAAEFSKYFGCEAVVGYDALIEREDIDALYVPLPTGMHYEWVGKAISAGKHVYVEKSFASNVIDCKSLIRMAEKNGVALMEGYMFLYHKQHSFVAEMIRAGELGELRHFYGSFGFPPLPVGDFRYDPLLGGGVLMDAAGYPLRAAQHFAPNDLMVRAATIRRDPATLSSLWGSAYLSDGLGFGASIAFGFDNAYQCRYEIWGSLAKVTSERAYTAGPDLHPKIYIEKNGTKREIVLEAHNHFVAALENFNALIWDRSQSFLHNGQILNQSLLLEEINRLSLICG